MVDLNKNGKLEGRAITNEDFTHATATVSTKSVLEPSVAIHTDTPEAAFYKVTSEAGANLCRDSVDRRLVSQVMSLGTDGRIIDSEEQVGGAPKLRSAEAPKDTDHDGIPDEWEKAHHLNPSDPEDASRIDPATGYSYLKEYVNAVADNHSKEMFKLLNRFADCQ
jgi:hypothetical protein